MFSLFAIANTWVLLTPLAALAASIASFVVLTHRRRAEIAASDHSVASGNGLFRLIASLAFGYAAGAVVTAASTAATIVGALNSRSVEFDIGQVLLPLLSTETTELPGGLVEQKVLDGIELSAGYYSQLTLFSPPISNGAAILYFTPLVIAPLLHMVVAIGIGMLAASVDRRAAFAPGLVRVATGVGLSLLFLGLASEVIGAIGIDRAAAELFVDSPLVGTSGFGQLDLSAPVAGLAVLLVGALAKRGLALQRDTEGLV